MMNYVDKYPQTLVILANALYIICFRVLMPWVNRFSP